MRADGNAYRGYGHVIRTLSLAAMLKKRYALTFAIIAPDPFLKKEIRKTCTLKELKEKNARSSFLGSIGKNDIVILDGYDLDELLQTEIKKRCFKLICIDDLHDRHFAADAVINHCEGIKPERYSKEWYTKLHLGSKYAILRPSFLSRAKTDHQKVMKPPFRAFINMGGTDPENFTEKALKHCLRISEVKEIDIVVGGFYRYKEELTRLCETQVKTGIRIHSNLSEQEISALMQRSAFGICSASTVSYEYASVGGILFLFKTIGNQNHIHRFLIRTGLAFPVSELKPKLELLRDREKALNYFTLRSSYFGGTSSANLLKIFDAFEKERTLKLRPAGQQDVLLFYRWVNDPLVRKNSFSTAPIPLRDHKAWYKARLKNSDTSIFVFHSNKEPLGQVRFDRNGDLFEIDYSVAKRFRGKGYGEIMMKLAVLRKLEGRNSLKLSAKVKDANEASLKVFEKLGFRLAGKDRRNKLSHFELSLKNRN